MRPRMPNREALSLYREVLRTARQFFWNNEQGQPWSQVLAQHARKEFEEGRHERDPLVVARMLVIGRDALMEIHNKLAQAQQDVMNNVNNSRVPDKRQY